MKRAHSELPPLADDGATLAPLPPSEAMNAFASLPDPDDVAASAVVERGGETAVDDDPVWPRKRAHSDAPAVRAGAAAVVRVEVADVAGRVTAAVVRAAAGCTLLPLPPSEAMKAFASPI
mmetsp:Transcript_67319/g.133399  ORF Transcript_67319/g.133399 Transcript_67319/m.133399 type:complete len:120 (-) Transcript_67319:71-430(-)